MALCACASAEIRPTINVVLAADAPQHVESLPDGVDVWFNVSPTSLLLQYDSRFRGTAAQVPRLAALYADFDVKPGACESIEHAMLIVDDLAGLIGTWPVTVVHRDMACMRTGRWTIGYAAEVWHRRADGGAGPLGSPSEAGRQAAERPRRQRVRHGAHAAGARHDELQAGRAGTRRRVRRQRRPADGRRSRRAARRGRDSPTRQRHIVRCAVDTRRLAVRRPRLPSRRQDDSPVGHRPSNGTQPEALFAGCAACGGAEVWLPHRRPVPGWRPEIARSQGDGTAHHPATPGASARARSRKRSGPGNEQYRHGPTSSCSPRSSTRTLSSTPWTGRKRLPPNRK